MGRQASAARGAHVPSAAGRALRRGGRDLVLGRLVGLAGRFERGGLLFHGDNKEVLAHLLANGFRGKVDLVYIDPPFDSGADYVRRVQLRGASGTARLDGESYTLGEQIQYTDIWANDNYLQFMYERLLLIKELSSPSGTIWVHLDWHRHAQIRLIMDEVFGVDSFTNEVVWWYFNKMQGNVGRFASNHDVLLCYRRGDRGTFHPVSEERPVIVRQLKRVWDPAKASLVNAKDAEGNLVYVESASKLVDDVWRVIALQPADPERLDFPTQKPEDLLALIIGSTSNPGDIVLDCFIGSGTTAAVAQKLGRRWIGADINKGAIQTTEKRLAAIMREQAAKSDGGQQQRLMDDETEGEPLPAQLSFSVHRVNDYDLQIQHNEAVNLAVEHLGVQRIRTDSFFEGNLGRELVKIIPFDHPLTPLDLQAIEAELRVRPQEERDIVVVALGKELAADAWLADYARRSPINKLRVIELRTDPKYGGFFEHRPASARVELERLADGRARVTVRDFMSPSIIERLKGQEGVLSPQITDWRAMVDSVMVDPAYDGQTFRIALADIPERKA
ncbi:MAG: site-specific DNA-methyltransferase, partial [Chloroflexi bacterium]|nr:site-specific DNA-methyltransferase [Chloroflexota bacterium]